MPDLHLVLLYQCNNQLLTLIDCVFSVDKSDTIQMVTWCEEKDGQRQFREPQFTPTQTELISETQTSKEASYQPYKACL